MFGGLLIDLPGRWDYTKGVANAPPRFPRRARDLYVTPFALVRRSRGTAIVAISSHSPTSDSHPFPVVNCSLLEDILWQRPPAVNNSSVRSVSCARAWKRPR